MHCNGLVYCYYYRDSKSRALLHWRLQKEYIFTLILDLDLELVSSMKGVNRLVSKSLVSGKTRANLLNLIKLTGTVDIRTRDRTEMEKQKRKIRRSNIPRT